MGRAMATADGQQQGFWAHLTMSEQSALRAIGAWRSFEPSSVILVKDDASDHVLILWSGYAKVHLRVGGDRDVVLAVRGPGDIVGEMVSISGGRRSAMVTAIGDVMALGISAERFTNFLDRSPHASSVLRRVLVERLREGDRYRFAAGTLSVERRLARLLLEFARRYGTPTGDGGTKVALALTQKDLAAFVGGSQRTIARAMERWREREIVVTGRRWVIVKQTPALRRIAGLSGPGPGAGPGAPAP
jgi:CRP/FNR family cyclic AMP-dependent transcriptional regulator